MIIVYTCFFVVWEPTNVEFWIPQVTALWMLAAVLVEGRRAALVLGVAAGAVAIANLFGTASRHPPRQRPLRRALHGRRRGASAGRPRRRRPAPHRRRLRPALHGGHTVAATSVSVVVALEDTSPPPAEMLIDRAAHALERGHRVAVDADLVVAPSGGAAAYTGDLFEFWFAARWRVVDVPGPPGDWYLIDPPPGAASGS